MSRKENELAAGLGGGDAMRWLGCSRPVASLGGGLAAWVRMREYIYPLPPLSRATDAPDPRIWRVSRDTLGVADVAVAGGGRGQRDRQPLHATCYKLQAMHALLLLVIGEMHTDK